MHDMCLLHSVSAGQTLVPLPRSCRALQAKYARAELGSAGISWQRKRIKAACISSTKRSIMPSTAFVYCGEGAGHRSVLSTLQSLRATLDIKVSTLGAEELLRGGWQASCEVLCIPGGADLPYCRDLNGKGTALIRDYVVGGGSYLGLCAGAYFACERIEFELGTPLEVKGKRELGFFPGVAKGAVYSGFEYASEAGTNAAYLEYQDVITGEGKTCRDYSNGGPAFIFENLSSHESLALASYAKDIPSQDAAVKCKVGKGVAVLCGTHPELDPSWLDPACSAQAIREAHPDFSDIKIARLIDRAKAVRLCLRESAESRLKFWRVLLTEAGLQQNLLQQQT